MSATTREPATIASVDAPPAAELRAAMRAFASRSRPTVLFGRPLRAWAVESRASLGLPDDRPIVMTGHQAGVWHPGILAKWLIADETARADDAAVAALVVDQDVNEAGRIAYPTLGPDGSLRVASLPARPAAAAAAPTGLLPPTRLDAPAAPPVADIAERLERIRAAVDLETRAPNLALQMSLANSQLLRERFPAMAPVANVAASALLRTPIGERLLGAMQRDPAACAAAYNQALAADPRVARPLGPDELPLWRLVADPRAPRREPVRGKDLSGALAPRAMLMTAIARIALGDLFVHGTGGGRYERVTEVWLGRWLGVDPDALVAPMAVATATVRLPLEGRLAAGPITTAADLRRAAFDPDAAEGADGPSAAKRRLLAAIDAAPRRSGERRAAYRAMLAHLDERRRATATRLEVMRDAVAASRALAASIDVARSRTWPWPLHDDATLTALGDRVRGRA